jgi:NAD(P)-dependent dehydrogenase (short-subunit alcohol dehydrogenase family)
MMLAGKVALVTGSGGGIGREIATAMAKAGAKVVVNDIGASVTGTGGDDTPGRQTVQLIEQAGGEAVLDTHSVADWDSAQAIVNTAVTRFGRLDIVVNNAGILRDKSFHNMGPDLVDPVLDVHLRGAFYVTQPAWVHMREQAYGRIVVTASSAGLFGNFGQANYGAAKMGLVGLAHVLAQEGERYNIKANAIAPTAGTRMTREIFGDELADKLAPGLMDRHRPARRREAIARGERQRVGAAVPGTRSPAELARVRVERCAHGKTRHDVRDRIVLRVRRRDREHQVHEGERCLVRDRVEDRRRIAEARHIHGIEAVAVRRIAVEGHDARRRPSYDGLEGYENGRTKLPRGDGNRARAHLEVGVARADRGDIQHEGSSVSNGE